MDSQVELHDAFLWDCDNCGTENICRIFELPSNDNLTKEQQSDIREELGLADWQDLPDNLEENYIDIPLVVKCKFCQTEFEPIPPRPIHQEDEE